MTKKHINMYKDEPPWRLFPFFIYQLLYGTKKYWLSLTEFKFFSLWDDLDFTFVNWGFFNFYEVSFIKWSAWVFFRFFKNSEDSKKYIKNIKGKFGNSSNLQVVYKSNHVRLIISDQLPFSFSSGLSLFSLSFWHLNCQSACRPFPLPVVLSFCLSSLFCYCPVSPFLSWNSVRWLSGLTNLFFTYRSFTCFFY
jgi:hypothetical protein